MEMNWYTLYTEPNREKKVTAILKRRQITHFCPVSLISRQENKLKNYESFSGYVFVNVPETQISSLKEIRGIRNFMYWMNKPATITAAEIDLIKNFLDKYPKVTIEKKEVGFESDFSYMNDRRENEGKLVYMNDHKVKLAIPSLGYVMTAEPQKSVVRLEKPENVVNYLKLKRRYLVAK